MCNEKVNLGDAFLLGTPPKGMHLFVAVLPLTNTKYLFFNVTKKVGNSDLSCVIKPGAGVSPFIQQESVINYLKPREIPLPVILKLIETNECIFKGKFSPNILYKIQVGVTTSERTPEQYVQLMKKYLNRE